MFPRNKTWQRLPGIKVLAFYFYQHHDLGQVSYLLWASPTCLAVLGPGHGDEVNRVPLLKKHPSLKQVRLSRQGSVVAAGLHRLAGLSAPHCCSAPLPHLTPAEGSGVGWAVTSLAVPVGYRLPVAA